MSFLIYFAISLLISAVIMPALRGTNSEFIDGPRMNDLYIQTSTYDATIARLWGTHRFSGNIVWLGPVREVKIETTENFGGKGGGGDTNITTSTYHYFASICVTMCAGPVNMFYKIWADNELIYDRDLDTIWLAGAAARQAAREAALAAMISAEAAAQETATLSGTDWFGTILSNTVMSDTPSPGNPYGLVFTFRLGTEDQVPTAVEEAALGVGKVPGYRGIANMVIHELPLHKFGNRIPQLWVEMESS